MSIDPRILKRMQAQEADSEEEGELPPGRLESAQRPQLNGLCELVGSEKQVKWAENIRSNTFSLRWPNEVKKKLARIKDATWWIANQAITRTMKFKEPSPEQLIAQPPSKLEQPELPTSGAPAAAADYESCPSCHGSFSVNKPVDGRCPHCDFLLGTISPRTHAAQKQINLQERVTDAEKWAESVSHNPKLAESAILAVLSRLYKEPMKSRLRTLAWHRLGEAQCQFAKDEDAIKRMLTAQ